MAALVTLSSDYFVGLDLGQAQDPTAQVVLERAAKWDPTNTTARPVEHFAARHLQRWQLGTSYPAIVEQVVEMLARPPLDTAQLVVDGTGVGRAVVDLFRRVVPSHRLLAVTITAGKAVNYANGFYCVPKLDLVAAVQVLLSSRRLQIAEVPERKVLLKELANFRVTQKAITGHETFEAWREGDHDDLVLALALAAWRALKFRGATAGDDPLGYGKRGDGPAWRRYGEIG